MSGSRYPIPAAEHRTEEVIERSRFITTVAHAPDGDVARAFIERIRAEFADATHNCWAFVAGPPGSSTHIGMSDDGEPHGTAGKPMLNVLLHADVGEVAAVVTRYYGGVKLGRGGLGRAYASGVQRTLESLPRAERIEWIPARLTVEYAHIDLVRRLLDEHEVAIDEETYGAGVAYELRIPASRLDALRPALAGATAGRATLALRHA